MCAAGRIFANAHGCFGMTRRQWLRMAVDSLRGGPDMPLCHTPCIVHEDSPRRAAELLLCAALALDKLSLVRDPDIELSSAELFQASALLSRRMQAEPMAYILGTREFYGRDFAVNPSTLIPRPETECLVDTALLKLPAHDVCFVDLGSGSGCIAVTLAAERPQWRGVGLDIDEVALTVARANADAHSVAGRVAFMHGDMNDAAVWALLTRTMGDGGNFCGKFDLVVSNPPYISEAEYAGLEPDVRLFEPKLALVAEHNGLALPTAAERAARMLLRPGALFLMEHGEGQGAATRGLCASGDWDSVATAKDFAGKDRYLVAYRSSSPSCHV